MPSIRRAALGATLLAVAAGCGGGDAPLLPEVSPPTATVPPGGTAPPIGVVRTDCVVVSNNDGDTFRCRLPGATRDTAVRLLLVDAPETAQSPWGDSSRVALQRWVPVGRTVQLERETEDTDANGRLLRYLFVGDTNVVVQLAGAGYVVAFPFPRRSAPNSTRYLAAVDSAVAVAQGQRRGLWGTAYAFSPLPCAFRGSACP
ncbi:MAG: thermonuclease family protein [Gemmatimonadaceae bacterium]|nr:thermonuclease family protein [Gemmatimonadaceae bacterium]